MKCYEQCLKHFFLLLFLMPSYVNPYAAGILPYVVKDGEIKFLLSQEQEWNGGDWCDFGGSGNRGEDAKAAAIREFTEESEAMWGKYALGLPLRSKQDKKTIINASNNYISSRMRGPLPDPENFYTPYLAKVDYIPAEDFIHNKGKFDNEKRNYRWISAQGLLDAMHKVQNPYKAFYQDMKIRPPFVGILKTNEMQQVLHAIKQEESFCTPQPLEKQSLESKKQQPITEVMEQELISLYQQLKILEMKLLY